MYKLTNISDFINVAPLQEEGHGAVPVPVPVPNALGEKSANAAPGTVEIIPAHTLCLLPTTSINKLKGIPKSTGPVCTGPVDGAPTDGGTRNTPKAPIQVLVFEQKKQNQTILVKGKLGQFYLRWSTSRPASTTGPLEAAAEGSHPLIVYPSYSPASSSVDEGAAAVVLGTRNSFIYLPSSGTRANVSTHAGASRPSDVTVEPIGTADTSSYGAILDNAYFVASRRGRGDSKNT
jgi:hypothetical protein